MTVIEEKGNQMKKEEKFPASNHGPVPSRRLGYSLGVDLLPFKTCSLSCIYCQLGRSQKKTIRRINPYSEKIYWRK